MLCYHCWMFSLSDAMPMQSYPSKAWVLCQCGCADLCMAQLTCFLLVYFSTCMKLVVYHGKHFEDVDFIVVECSFY